MQEELSGLPAALTARVRVRVASAAYCSVRACARVRRYWAVLILHGFVQIRRPCNRVAQRGLSSVT